MNSELLLQRLYNRYGVNEIIFASQAYREILVNEMKEKAFYKQLDRLCDAEKLQKISKGAYYIPKQSKYGPVPISESSIINTFTSNNSGMVIGYVMYNRLGLTTQVSKSINVLTSKSITATRTIENIKIKRVTIDFSEQVIAMIQMMEILSNFEDIQDLNCKIFMEYSEKFSQVYSDEIFKQVDSELRYPKWTIAFLKEMLDFYGTENNLEQYLSSLSNYKHPKMGEIYALARR